MTSPLQDGNTSWYPWYFGLIRAVGGSMPHISISLTHCNKSVTVKDIVQGIWENSKHTNQKAPTLTSHWFSDLLARSVSSGSTQLNKSSFCWQLRYLIFFKQPFAGLPLAISHFHNASCNRKPILMVGSQIIYHLDFEACFIRLPSWS